MSKKKIIILIIILLILTGLVWFFITGAETYCERKSGRFIIDPEKKCNGDFFCKTDIYGGCSKDTWCLAGPTYDCIPKWFPSTKDNWPSELKFLYPFQKILI